MKIIREYVKMAKTNKKMGKPMQETLEFEFGGRVFIKISSMKGAIRFDKKGKFSPKNIRPFEIAERITNFAYRLSLTSEIKTAHNVFHMS